MGKKPVLVIMAAGLGSRYGGLKQLDAMDEGGHRLIDYAVFDAKRAGFETVFFIIREENQSDFHELIGRRMEKYMKVTYVHQELQNLPEGLHVPPERTKPLGTGHAVWCCRNAVDAPFAVINADDYYGAGAYRQMYGFLTALPENAAASYAMAGYRLERTLSEHGTVARGICRVNADGCLAGIDEQTSIQRRDGVICCQADGGERRRILEPDTVVSMNMWGLTPDIFQALDDGLHCFLRTELFENPLKSECYLPKEIGRLIEEGSARVRVLPVDEQWYGVTYKEDKPLVSAALSRMREEGIYPEQLWEACV